MDVTNYCSCTLEKDKNGELELHNIVHDVPAKMVLSVIKGL